MLSNKNDYDNFEHLKLSIEKPRGQLLCYVQYVRTKLFTDDKLQLDMKMNKNLRSMDTSESEDD